MIEKKVRVLIVDDSRQFATIISDYLESKGSFKVVGCVADGLEALTFIRNIQVDLIILDLVMPKLDGVGVLEEMNTMSFANRPKVVVVSAVSNDIFTSKALNLGANYYITKPFDIELFAKKLQDLFNSDSEDNINTNTNIECSNKGRELEVEISEVLHRLGSPVHIKGYSYVKEAITMVLTDPSAISGLTTVIYPAIAEKYMTTTSRVERAIRHLVEVISSGYRTELWEQLFSNTINFKKKRPTNGEFIAIVAESIRLKLKVTRF